MASEGEVKWLEMYTRSADPQAKPNLGWVKSVAGQFEQRYPFWKVKFEYTRGDQIDQKAILDMVAGIPHDLVFSSPQMMAKHLALETFIDLQPFFVRIDRQELADLAWSPAYQAANVGGRQLGLPMGVHIRTHAYNRTWWRAAGVDPAQPLSTLDEVVEIARKTTKSGQGVWGLVMYLGEGRTALESFFGPTTWAFGGDFYDAASRRATLDSQASVQAAKWIFDLIFTHKVTPPDSFAAGAKYADLVLQTMLKGRAAQAMGFVSTWIGALEGGNAVKGCYPARPSCEPTTVGVMVMPGAARAQFANAWCLSIHSLSQVAPMAWELMVTALRPDNLLSYPDAGLPARQSAWNRPEYASAFYQTWFEAAKNGRPMPATPFYPELASAVSAALREILYEKSDIPATLKRYNDDWNGKYAGQ